VHRIGVGIGTYIARVDQHYQSILTWATYSTDGQHFRERIEKGDYSHKDKLAFVNTVRAVLTAHAGRVPTDDGIWRFLGSFVIIHFDFQSGEASRDAMSVVDRLKGLLAPANRGLAAGIWNHLVKKAGELIRLEAGLPELRWSNSSVEMAFLSDLRRRFGRTSPPCNESPHSHSATSSRIFTGCDCIGLTLTKKCAKVWGTRGSFRLMANRGRGSPRC
jgi:hypothetical protein